MHVLYAAVRDKSTAMNILSQFVYVRTPWATHRSKDLHPPKLEPVIKKRQPIGHCGDLDSNTGCWADNVYDVDDTDKSHTIWNLVNSK